MKIPSHVSFAAIVCLAAAPAIWAGSMLTDGLLERDAQRLERARETHVEEIGRAFEVYATRVDRANSTLSRIYEPLIERYAARGDNDTAEKLKGELADLLADSLAIPFPTDGDGSDSPPSADAHRQLIAAVGPQLVNAEQQRAPSDRIAEYDYIMLYFTAGWCGPCRAFTPDLVQFYNENRSLGKWEIIVVSGDRSENDFYGYLRGANMPWAAIPFDRIGPSNLMQSHPGGFPRLVILDREGRQAVPRGNRVQMLSQFQAILRQ